MLLCIFIPWQGGWMDPADLRLSYENLLVRRQAVATQAAASLSPTPAYPVQVLYPSQLSY